MVRLFEKMVHSRPGVVLTKGAAGEVPKWKPLTTCNVSSPATKIDPSRDVRLESKNLSAEEEASKVTEKWARL